MLPDGVPDAGTGAARTDVTVALRAIWERHRPAVLERLDVLERAARSLAGGQLEPALREEATAAAHRLAGSLGTFGMRAASECAHRVELLLDGERRLGSADAPALATLTDAIAEQVRGTAQTPLASGEPPAPATPPAGSPSVLIVEDDAALAERLALEARRQALDAEVAASPAAARAYLARERPDAVLLDLTFADGTADALALLSELSDSTPPVPVLVSTVRDELGDRVEVARRGGRSFVPKSLPAEAVVAQLIRLIEHARAGEVRVLAVDDDPALLDAVQALLAPEGYRVTTLAEPLRFWQELERVRPDVILLDIEMPDVSGLELCRVLRNDARWATVPVLILTARRDAATIEQIFAAGADDHLAKPLHATELQVRLRNRVERLRLHRALEETDELTGVANRSAAAAALERLIRLAARNERPLTLALLDVDRFKAVNDRHGHAAGDDVLRGLGRFLRGAFRGEDVVGRWGGEEFVVGMYGMGANDAVARLERLLADFGAERFAGGDGPFHVAFSAGVAVHPRDGTALDALVAAADAALYRAKEAGRARVERADPSSANEEPPR